MKALFNLNSSFGTILDESNNPILTICFGIELPLEKKETIMNMVINELSESTTDSVAPMTWEQKKKEFKILVLQQETQHIIVWHMENILGLPEKEANKRYTLGQTLKDLLGKTHEEVIDSVYCVDFDFQGFYNDTMNFLMNPPTDETIVETPVGTSAGVEIKEEVQVLESNETLERQELMEIEKLITLSRTTGEGLETDKISRYLELRKKYGQ